MSRISGVNGAIVTIDLTEFQSRSHVPEVCGSMTLALRSEVIRSRIIGRPKQCMIPTGRLKDGVYEVVPKNANLIDTDRPEEWPELFTDAHVTPCSRCRSYQRMISWIVVSRRKLSRSASIIGSYDRHSRIMWWIRP